MLQLPTKAQKADNLLFADNTDAMCLPPLQKCAADLTLVFVFYLIIVIASNAVAELEKIVYANEYKARTTAGHP